MTTASENEDQSHRATKAKRKPARRGHEKAREVKKHRTEEEACDMEEDSHDWKKGTRIGENKQPGSSHGTYTNYYAVWPHAPEGRSKHFQVRDRQCGSWAVPIPPAGVFAKGIHPGSIPHGDQIGKRPVGSAMWRPNSTIMKSLQNSRPGSAQGIPYRRREERAGG